MRTRVLHIYRTYYPDPPGGLQEAIRQICLSTQGQGVESEVFALSPEPEPVLLERPEARVMRARSWWAPASCDLGLAASFERFSEAAQRADILHFHFPWPFADLLNLLPVSRQKRRVMSYHADIIRQRTLGTIYRPLMRHTLSSMDRVVATSPNYAHSSNVIQDMVDASKLRIIPLGIQDRAQLTDAASSHSGILERLGVSPNHFVLSLGVLRYYKGLHTLVQAAMDIDAPVVIAGDGPEADNLKSQAHALGLDNVIFAGRVSDAEKDELLASCRLFAFPSHLRSEAFGMALVEASMYAKPMVTCEIGSGMSYVNQHGQTGLIVQPESPVELANAINHLLQDDSLAGALGRGARQRYEEEFSGHAQGRAWSSLYGELTQELDL